MLEIRLLGGFELQIDGRPVLIPSRPAQTLLAYLLLNRQTAHRREKLAGLIWPDNLEPISRRNLRQALWYVRKAIDAPGPEGSEYIQADEIWVAFNMRSNHWLDVAVLEDASAEDCTTEQLLRAVAVHRGDLLPGFYEDWVLLERERLNAQYDRSMQVLLSGLTSESRWTDVLRWGERWIATGHIPEPAYRALMVAHSNLGDLGAVATVFQRCRAVLADELGVEPSTQTIELYDSLRQGRKVAALPAAPAVQPRNAGQASPVTDQAPAPGDPPFKGLQYFEEADAGLFFGREPATARLVTRLREKQPLIAVVGASGSGKSSLVRAGLIPALRRGVPLSDGSRPPDGSERWPIFVLTPTAHPLEALASALTSHAESVLKAASLMDDLARDPRSLQLAMRRLSAEERTAEGGGHALLVVDQFEELFILCQSEAERRAFINNLLAAADTLSVVIALRADFYAHCARYDELRGALPAGQEYIGPMSAAELRRAIEEPARRGGWIFEPGLVDLILRDMGDEPGALPLLSHSLRETWQRRHGRNLTLAGYAEAGGVHGAIAKTAEHVYQGLSAYEQATARSIFLRLTELGEGTQDTRRRACLSELTLRPEDAIVVAIVLRTLADARLVILGEDSAEVAHEALIREWPTLRQWLAEDREGLRLHRRLTAATDAWDVSGRDPSELYRGARLAQASEWASANAAQLNPLEREFLDASGGEAARETAEREVQQQREVEAARRLAQEQSRSAALLRRRALYLAAALIVALAGSLLATWFANRANQVSQGNLVLAAQNASIAATVQANLGDSERLRLAAEAKALVESGTSGELPALLALRSLRAGYSPQADAALVSALAHGFTRLRLTGHTQAVTAASFSANGQYILTASLDGTTRLSDAITGHELQLFNSYFEVTAATFDPKDRQVLTGSLDGKVHIWDVETGAEVRQFQAHTGGVNALAASPNGAFLITAGQDGTARIWNLPTGRELRRFTGHAGPVASAAFSPDGRLALTGGWDQTARAWDAATGVLRQTYAGHGGKVLQVSYSPNGQRVLTGSADGTARVWDASTARELLRLDLGSVVNLASFTASGRYILTGGANKIAGLWDAETGEQMRQFIGSTAAIAAGGFSPDGRSLVTGLLDGSVRVWQVWSDEDPLILRRLSVGMLDAAMSADGKFLLTGGQDGSLRLWDTALWNLARQFVVQSEPVVTVAISPDGKYALTGGGNSAILVDLATGREARRFSGHETTVTGVAFSPDGKRAVTMSEDRRGRFWDVETGRELFEGLTCNDVKGVAYSSDGQYAVTACADASAYLWRTALTIDSMGRRAFTGHTEPLTGVAFSPDGKYVLTTSRDTSARLWETETGREVRDFVGHASDVLTGAFSPDGMLIATGSKDKTIRLWQTATGKEVRVLAGHQDAVFKLFFTADGRHLLSFSLDGTARLWNVDIRGTVSLACVQLFRDFSGQERSQYGINDTAPTCP